MLRRLQNNATEGDKNFTHQIDLTKKNLLERISKISSDTSRNLELLDIRMEELVCNSQKQREFMDTKLGRVDDSTVLKKWTER